MTFTDQITGQWQNTPLGALIESWEIDLRARNRAPKTVTTYLSAARLLTAYLAWQHEITEARAIQKIHVEGFVIDQLSRNKASSASVRYRAVQQWFKWMLAEDEIDEDPTARMSPPTVPEVEVPVLSVEEVRALLAACEEKPARGRSAKEDEFMRRRDTALVYLIIDTGLRIHEALVNLDDLNLRGQEVLVRGKNRRERRLRFGVKTQKALDRYLRIRATHRYSDSPALWLGERSDALTYDGLYRIVKRRAAMASVDMVKLDGIYPHQLRHTAVHQWLSHGGSEGDAMALFGWRSRQMLSRYAASAAGARARDAHKIHGFADRL